MINVVQIVLIMIILIIIKHANTCLQYADHNELLHCSYFITDSLASFKVCIIIFPDGNKTKTNAHDVMKLLDASTGGIISSQQFKLAAIRADF